MNRLGRAPRVPALLIGLVLASSACGGPDEAANEPSALPTPSATATSSDGTSAAPEPSPAPPPPPEVGSCHRLSWDDALAPTASNDGSDCARSTSLTFHVGTLGKAAGGTDLEVDSQTAQDRIAKACPRELKKFLGGAQDARRLTLLTTIWFTPTLEEANAGARWYRCDLVAPLAEQKLMQVSRGMRDALATPKAEKYALCAVGKPGSSTFAHVPCGRKHSWRAVSTIDIAGKEHPGRRAVAEKMESACTDVATELAEDKHNVRWGQEGPTRKQWTAGQRHGVCWVPA